MQPVSVLCICVCMCVPQWDDRHRSVWCGSFGEALLHFDSLCLHNTSHGNHAHLAEHLILSGPEVTIHTQKSKPHCDILKKRWGQIFQFLLSGQVACEWWTNSQVEVLWVKGTLILDTSWANKEREWKERGRVKEKKAEGVEFKTASLLSKSCLWKSLEQKEMGQSKCLSRKSKLWSVFADYCSRWHCMRAILAGLPPCSSIPR